MFYDFVLIIYNFWLGDFFYTHKILLTFFIYTNCLFIEILGDSDEEDSGAESDSEGEEEEDEEKSKYWYCFLRFNLIGCQWF